MPTLALKTTKGDHMAVKDDIIKLFNEFAQALSRKDAKAVVGYYADDVIGFEIAPPLVSHAKDLRDPKNLQKWFDTWEGNLEVGTRDHVVHADGNLAHLSQLLSLSGNKKGEGRSSAWFRSSVLFKKQGDTWKVIHFHESVPMSMDGSKRAMTELQP